VQDLLLCVEINDNKSWIVLDLCSKMNIRCTFQPSKVQTRDWMHLCLAIVIHYLFSLLNEDFYLKSHRSNYELIKLNFIYRSYRVGSASIYQIIIIF
jgi:hypothetical protein